MLSWIDPEGNGFHKAPEWYHYTANNRVSIVTGAMRTKKGYKVQIKVHTGTHTHTHIHDSANISDTQKKINIL